MSKKDPKIITADEDKFYVQFDSGDIWTEFDDHCYKHGNGLERFQTLYHKQVRHFDKQNLNNIKGYYNFNNFLHRAQRIEYLFSDKDGKTFTLNGWEQMFNSDTLSFDCAISKIKDSELKDVRVSPHRGPGKYYQKIRL